MQFKVLSVLALAATLAAATAVPRNTGSSIQCCDTTGKASDPSIAKELGLLGIVVQDVDVLVGLDCTPITVIGAGGNSCSAETVSCTDNSHGLVAIGCTPITL